MSNNSQNVNAVVKYLQQQGFEIMFYIGQMDFKETEKLMNKKIAPLPRSMKQRLFK